MKIMLRITSIAVLIAFSSFSRADLVLDLRLDDTTRARTVASGDSVFVDMFLVDTDGSNAAFAPGLIAGGGRIFETNTGSAATGSFVSAGAGFNAGAPVTAPPGIAGGRVLFPGFGSVLPTAVGAGVTARAAATLATAVEVLIGRFEITTSGSAGNIHTLTADVLDRANGFTDNGNTALGVPPTNLDALLAVADARESVTLTVSAAAIPEASTILFAVLVGTTFFVIRKRRLATS